MTTRRRKRAGHLGLAAAALAQAAITAPALGAGDYGADTCLNGYVWRETVANDHVCVFPAWRQQARDDNAQARARRNSLHVWLTYYRPSQPPCTGNPCSMHSDDAQRYRVRADHINVGRATVLLRWTDRGRVKKGVADVAASARADSRAAMAGGSGGWP
jgi:hypothetical protein